MNLRHSLLLVTLAFGAGLFFTLWKRNELPDFAAPAQPEAAVGAEEAVAIKSDAFTLRLLQAAMDCTEGNILLAPHALTENLRVLHHMSQGATQAELGALQLNTVQQSAPEDAGEAAILFHDNSLQYSDNAPADNAIPVPLGGKAAEPILILNSILAEVTGDTQAHFINSEHLPAGSRLVSFCTLTLQPAWKYPVRSYKEAHADFFNANGSMPQIRTVQSCGAFRQAKAQDDTWQAIAIPLQLSPKSAKDECLLLIMPREHSARRFAQQLSPELLNTIRQALAEAEPSSLCVEFPRLSFAPPTQDLLPILRALGLKTLLSPQAEIGGLAKDKPLFLNAVLQKCRIPLVENRPELPQDMPDLRLDKPFVWIIGSLHSSAPPYAIGIVENL